MAMGVVTDSDFESQLKNVTPPSPPTESQAETPESDGQIIQKERGRGKGNVEVPSTLRNLIAGTAAVEGREEALNLARIFNISNSSVSAYSNGASSTASYNKPKTEIKDVINTRKRHASRKALRKLHSTLDNIEEVDLKNLGPKDLASIAKDLAGVVKIMTPDEGHVSGPLVQFQLFSPPTRSENEYEVIQVNE